MKKELVLAQENYYKECEIDPRTLPMIVRHYLSIGEQAAAGLTDDKIEKVYQQAVQKQKATESKGSVCLITPEFQKYILKACQQLNTLPDQAKYDIIKKNI